MSNRLVELMLIAGFLAATRWLAADPFVGKWKVNPAKSQLNDEMKIEVLRANEYILTFEPGAVDTIVADGADHRSLGGTTLSMTPQGDNGWRVVRKNKNRTLISANWKLAADGNTLTDDYTQFADDGSKMKVNYVYERTAGSSGLAGTWDSSGEHVQGTLQLQIEPYKQNGLSFVMRGSGLNESITFDGADYPEGPKALQGATRSGRRVSDRRVEIIERVHGTIRQTQLIELSPDFRTLTMTFQLTGQSRPQAALVFDRL